MMKSPREVGFVVHSRLVLADHSSATAATRNELWIINTVACAA